MSTRILFVDDEPHVLAALRRTVAGTGEWDVDTAGSGLEALQKIRENGPYAAVIVDQRMPGLTGLNLLQQIAKEAPNTTRVMLTGNLDQQTAVGAVNEGQAFRYLNKPCNDGDLLATIKAAIAQNELLTSRQALLEKTLAGSLGILTDVLSMVDPMHFGEAQFIRDKAKELCKHAEYPNPWQIEVGAMLANVGLVSVPSQIATKTNRGDGLNEAERALMSRVPKVGYELIKQIPYLEPVAEIVLYQDKRFNGAGYPEETVSGEDIPFGARVLKVLRDFCLLEKECQEARLALKTMSLRRGWYDPAILEDAYRAFSSHAPLAGSRVYATTARCLRVGQVLAGQLTCKDGRLLAGEGTEVSPLLLAQVGELAGLEMVVEPIQVYEESAA